MVSPMLPKTFAQMGRDFDSLKRAQIDAIGGGAVNYVYAKSHTVDTALTYWGEGRLFLAFFYRNMLLLTHIFGLFRCHERKLPKES